jgi:CRP-like cAMP-binding protein
MPSVVFEQHDQPMGAPIMTENHIANHILAALPVRDYRRLVPNLEPFALVYGDELIPLGTQIKHVYFPNSGIVSLLSRVDARSSLEVGIVGREGLIGLPLFLGVEKAANRSLVQGSGDSVRLTAAAFKTECGRGGRLPALLRRFTQSLITQISQTAVCFRFHSADQRLARWLLMTADRMDSNSFLLTQAFLADMLGVRREAVNKSAVVLHSQGLINYSRGQITINDRRQLKRAACKCYNTIRAEELEAVIVNRRS